MSKPTPPRDLPADVTEYLDRVIDDAIQASEKKARNTALSSQRLTTPGFAQQSPELGIEPESVETVLDAQPAEETTAVDLPCPPQSSTTLETWEPPVSGAQKDAKPARREQPYTNSLALAEKRLGPNHPELADLLANLALIHHRRGEYAEAEGLQRRALRIRETALGKDDPKVATSLNNLALLCKAQSKNAEAQELWERSLEILERAFGTGHPKTAVRISSLADLSYADGDLVRAEGLYQRLLEILERGPLNRQKEIADSLKNYVALLQKTQRAKLAREVENRLAAMGGVGGPAAVPKNLPPRRFWRW